MKIDAAARTVELATNFTVGDYLDAVAHDPPDQEELQSLIDETNVRTFGVTLDKRKQLFENLRKSFDDYLDVPTYFRQGRKPGGGQVSPCPE